MYQSSSVGAATHWSPDPLHSDTVATANSEAVTKRPPHLPSEEKGSAEFVRLRVWWHLLEGPLQLHRQNSCTSISGQTSSSTCPPVPLVRELPSQSKINNQPPTMSPGITLFSVQAVLILSCEDGSRILAKYYNAPHSAPATAGTSNPGTNPYRDLKSQKAFEKGLIEKTAKQTGDIILYDNRIVLYKLESDVMIYVVGNSDDNEILLYNTVLAIRDSLHLVFK
jgi:hypothetical protein